MSDSLPISFQNVTESHKLILYSLNLTNKNALLLAFQENGIPTFWFPNRDEAVNYLNTIIKPDDVVLFENDLPDHYP